MVSTKEKIIDAADLLFYQNGFEATSFAEIAEVVDISRGNFYYHFKTKDEILDAVIQRRLNKTKLMLQDWETDAQTPSGRIKCFVRILLVNGEKIKQFGCPVGTLTTELAKLKHHSQDAANEIFSLFNDWLAHEFREMGVEQSTQKAMHVLARSQGVATLYQALKDDDFVDNEVQQICAWVDQLQQG